LDQRLQTPFTLEAGKSTVVKGESPRRVVISRFAVGEPDREIVTSDRVEEVVQAVIEAGGHYPDVVGLLHSAKMRGVLASRFEVDTVPQAGRRYDRPQSSQSAKSDESNFPVLGALPNLFGRRDEPDEPGDSTGEDASEQENRSTLD
jgi:hypothetical protein